VSVGRLTVGCDSSVGVIKECKVAVSVLKGVCEHFVM